MSELKACPFCGEEIYWNEYPDGEIQGHCTTKGCQLFFTDFIGIDINIWNARPLEDALRARIAELEAVTRWIPVSERLPEEWQNVLVIGRDGCIFNWLYTSRMVQPFILHWTHWMPFKPPKPEEVEG